MFGIPFYVGLAAIAFAAIAIYALHWAGDLWPAVRERAAALVPGSTPPQAIAGELLVQETDPDATLLLSLLAVRRRLRSAGHSQDEVKAMLQPVLVNTFFSGEPYDLSKE